MRLNILIVLVIASFTLFSGKNAEATSIHDFNFTIDGISLGGDPPVTTSGIWSVGDTFNLSVFFAPSIDLPKAGESIYFSDATFSFAPPHNQSGFDEFISPSVANYSLDHFGWEALAYKQYTNGNQRHIFLGSRLGYDEWAGTIHFIDPGVTSLTLQVSGALVPVPEPSTFLLLGSGLLGLACYGLKRKKASRVQS